MMNNYKVYKHTTPSNKIYIGITRTKPTQRWMNGKGYKNNKHFYNAIKKYGWNNIKHEILETNLSYKDAITKEQEYIKKYNSIDIKNGYNISPGGYVVDEKTREKMSKNNKKKIKIIYLTCNIDKEINIYICDSLKQCSKENNISETLLHSLIQKHKYTIEQCKKLSTDNFDSIEFLLFNKLQQKNAYIYDDELLDYMIHKWKLKDNIKYIKYLKNVSSMSVDV